MHTPISVQNKKYFIKWFLRHFTLKKLEATWTLNYLVKQDHLLSKVSFVRDARFCPRAIIITSTCSDGEPFLFYKQHVITDDSDKFFHDIRLNQDEKIYIQLNFKQANQNPLYASVLEENAFSPIETHLVEQDQDRAEEILGQLLLEYQLEELKKGIDQALDDKNESQFKKLVTALHKLEKTINLL